MVFDGESHIPACANMANAVRMTIVALSSDHCRPSLAQEIANTPTNFGGSNDTVIKVDEPETSDVEVEGR